MGLVASSDVAQPAGARAHSAANTNATRARGNGGDMAKLWYVSVAPPSTAVATRFMRDFGHLFLVLSSLLAGLGAAGCAAPSASGPAAQAEAAGPVAVAAAPTQTGARGANLAGARCHGQMAACECRTRG